MEDKKEILLFRPSMKTQAIIPPWACIYLAKPLIDRGYKVRIIDAMMDRNWLETAKQAVNKSTLCVGISVLTGKCIKQSLEFSEIVRNISKCPIVWGGVHCTMLPEQTIKASMVDYVFVGEGEESFSRFISDISSKKLKPEEIPGLVYKTKSNHIKINPPVKYNKILPGSKMVPFEVMKFDSYIYPNPMMKAHRSVELISSRGCPHRCSFCSSSGSKWRQYSTDEILSTLKKLKEMYKIDGVFFIDENFFVNRKKVEELCKEIVKHKLDLKMGGNIRVNYFSKYNGDFIKLLYKSGFRLLEFGVESGNNETLKLIKKDITVKQVLACLEKLSKYSFTSVMNFMYGFPGETIEQVLNTLSFILEIHKRNPQIIIRGPSFYTPYPGAEMYKESIQFGFTPPETLKEWGDYEWSTSKTWMHSAGKEDQVIIRKIFNLYFKLAKKFIWFLPFFRYRVNRYLKQPNISSFERFCLAFSRR